MLYIYLDKSGDLDFDFANKNTSRFFTICVLALRGQRNYRALAKAVKTALPLDRKKYFYKTVKGIKFDLYAVTLNKWKAYTMPSFNKDRVYNYIAGLAFKGIDFKDTAVKVTMTADIHGQGIGNIQLDECLQDQIQGWVEPLIPLKIFRLFSQESLGLGAAGLFARGLHMKHENGDIAWYSVFKEKVKSEQIY